MDPQQLKTWSEIAANWAQVATLASAIFVSIKWIRERNDRSTQVLLELDKRFNAKEVRKGRAVIEDDSEYAQLAPLFLEEIRASVEGPATSEIEEKRRPRQELWEAVDAVDAMLRFYVLIRGVRAAKQVKDAALRACFRYWLAHFYNPKRWEFRLYVHRFFPTLRQWLAEDRERNRLLRKTSFFGPEEFGWKTRRRPTVRQLRRAMRGRLLVITGAGISADSGIPTYRGKESYWEKRDPKTLATKAAFKKNPKLVWKWYNHRREVIRKAQPNAAHQALTKLARCAREFLLVTQNVDDLHERGGSDHELLVHIHGNIFLDKCTKCDYKSTSNASTSPSSLCPRCGARLRPGVVWFDEQLDPDQEKRVEKFIAKGPCDLILIIGTTATFDYIVDWVRRAAGDTGWIVEINPEESTVSGLADYLIRARAAEALPKLLALM